MATGPKIVHKQFNSPIGLYSQNNIQETLNKHLQNLDNGSVGIDFSQPGTDKPANLANSAVLRMLEEEERNRRGYPSQKKVVWPPVPETNGYHSPQAQQQRQPSPAFQNNAAQQQQQQYQQQPQQQRPQQPPQQAPQSPQYQQHHQPYPNPNQQQQGFCEGRRQAACGLSKLIPVGPGISARPVSPTPFNQGPTSPGIAPQPYRPGQGRWAPVASPLSPQKPSPVFASQPAAASYKDSISSDPSSGGVNMRGDQKWPPQQIREAVAAENEARRQLAKGPACRPRRVNKDYSSFFAQHRLNNNYPGYRAPPGTQHYEDYSGRSSY
ncbi:hypothetical protein NE865_15094 [Phthorimaea operculella]|nr:hypothetical protein NE865_15094 [Phthorimaea operculella]